MSLEPHILRVIKAEGYKINETIQMAVAELVDTVTDENDSMEPEDTAVEDDRDDD